MAKLLVFTTAFLLLVEATATSCATCTETDAKTSGSALLQVSEKVGKRLVEDMAEELDEVDTAGNKKKPKKDDLNFDNNNNVDFNNNNDGDNLKMNDDIDNSELKKDAANIDNSKLDNDVNFDIAKEVPGIKKLLKTKGAKGKPTKTTEGEDIAEDEAKDENGNNDFAFNNNDNAGNNNDNLGNNNVDNFDFGEGPIKSTKAADGAAVVSLKKDVAKAVVKVEDMLKDAAASEEALKAAVDELAASNAKEVKALQAKLQKLLEETQKKTQEAQKELGKLEKKMSASPLACLPHVMLLAAACFLHY